MCKQTDKAPNAEALEVFAEIVKRFVPDDVATADDIEAIEKGLEEYRNGETVNHKDIKW